MNIDTAREPRSHINAWGNAKRSYASPEEARAAAESQSRHDLIIRSWYLCAQGPNHWHITNRPPDRITG